MKRTWQVHPDMQIQTQQYGPVPVVSWEAFSQALVDGGVFLHRAGGTLSVITGRHPTDLPGEAVTTGAIIAWQSGPRAPAEPEAAVSLPAHAATAPIAQPEQEVAEQVEQDEPEDDIGDGFVPLADEDLEAIPAEMR